jgi:DNA-binding SARP family transcriptional activator
LSRLQVDVLGPLRLTVAGRPVRLHSRKQRLLLAALLVKAPRAFSAERLVDVLWDDDLPADPPAALQVHVSRLRRALSPPEGSDAVVTEVNGYRLALDDLELDAARFEQLVNGARRTDRAGEALENLDAALSLWRGAAYDEFAELPFARAEAGRVEELRPAALEQRAEALIALDQLDEALELLERLASTHPLRERPRDQLMRVLYRRGRQADALAVCREFRRLLSEELGSSPRLPSSSWRTRSSGTTSTVPAWRP